MYAILKKTSQNLPNGHWTYIALIDRSKNKNHWWTVNPSETFVFNSKLAAENKAKSLKYGTFKVIHMEEFPEYVGREFFKRKERMGLGDLLKQKEQEWHDDDWFEGINDD